MACAIEVYKTTGTSANKRIFDLIRAQFRSQCKGLVRHAYGSSQLSKSNYIFVATRMSQGTRSGHARTTVCGFLLLQHDKAKNSAYVDIVCSQNRYGSTLLKNAEEFARNVLKVKSIRLSALPHVISFYRKKEYRHLNNACVPRKEKRVGNNVNGYRMSKCLVNDPVQ